MEGREWLKQNESSGERGCRSRPWAMERWRTATRFGSVAELHSVILNNTARLKMRQINNLYSKKEVLFSGMISTH